MSESNETTANRVIDAIQAGEHSALVAVRKFIDTVDEALPALADDDGHPRRRVIDAGFQMVERLLGVSNEFARNIVSVTETAMGPDSTETPTTTKK